MPTTPGQPYIRPAELHITYRCNLSCKFCNRACFHKKTYMEDMTLEQVEKFLVAARDKETYCYVLIGGEPALHPDCVEIARMCADAVRHKENGSVQMRTNWSTAAVRAVCDECKKVGCGIVPSTKTESYGGEHWASTIYMSPADLGITRSHCPWGEKCGYSVDSGGYTACAIGGMISALVCPEVKTQNLDDMFDKQFVSEQLAKLCKYCGAHLALNPLPSQLYEYKGMSMTKTWYEAFTR